MPALLQALPPDFCLAKESYVIIINEQMKHLVLSLQPSHPNNTGTLEILLKTLIQVHSWCNFTTTNGGRAAVAETNLLYPKTRANKVYRVLHCMDLAVGTPVLTL